MPNVYRLREHGHIASCRRHLSNIRPKKVWDIGAGIRPFTWYDCPYVAVEPHDTYVQILRANNVETVHAEALEFLQGQDDGSLDTVLMIDSIEHMEKDYALEVLEHVRRAARRALVFTSKGFKVQSGTRRDGKDPWGLDGNERQRHKSGWEPEEFEGFKTYICTQYTPHKIIGIYRAR